MYVSSMSQDQVCSCMSQDLSTLSPDHVYISIMSQDHASLVHASYIVHVWFTWDMGYLTLFNLNTSTQNKMLCYLSVVQPDLCWYIICVLNTEMDCSIVR